MDGSDSDLSMVSTSSKGDDDGGGHAEVTPLVVFSIERGSTMTERHDRSRGTLKGAFESAVCQLRSARASLLLVPDFPTDDRRLVDAWCKWCAKSDLGVDTVAIASGGILLLYKSEHADAVKARPLECYHRSHVIVVESDDCAMVAALVNMPTNDVLLYNQVVIECRSMMSQVSQETSKPVYYFMCGLLNVDDNVYASLEEDADHIMHKRPDVVTSLWMDDDVAEYPPNAKENTSSTSSGSDTDVEVGVMAEDGSAALPFERQLKVQLLSRLDASNQTRKKGTHRRIRSMPAFPRRGKKSPMKVFTYRYTSKFGVRSSSSGFCSTLLTTHRRPSYVLNCTLLHPTIGTDVTCQTHGDAVRLEHCLACGGETPYLFKHRVAVVNLVDKEQS